MEPLEDPGAVRQKRDPTREELEAAGINVRHLREDDEPYEGRAPEEIDEETRRMVEYRVALFLRKPPPPREAP